MEKHGEPCSVCGSTDLKLIDGFYYCIECGTQNTNVREQVIEERALGDGTFALSSKKRITLPQHEGIEMSGEWYKWHAYNFIIAGLAEDLIALGAKPTFKRKLLWIWTRYIKKYQNKADLTMNRTQDDHNQTALTSFLVVEDSNPDQQEDDHSPENEICKKKTQSDVTEGSKRDIQFLSKGLIFAMLYLALNLDQSDIQLCHLYQFLQEKHLDIYNLNRFLPDDIKVKEIPQWINFLRSTNFCNHHQIRALAMTLLRKLDLGTPKVPDLSKITDDFLTELCLPSDIKPLIYALMHYRKCNFLDVDEKSKKTLTRLPDYECTVMSYILVALKLCFGLDCDYELKLSDAVDKINIERDLPKSFRMGKYSDSSDRLFSFREWCNYLQFRRIMLSKFNLRMAQRYCIDIDDHIYLEQMEERPKDEEELPDKISMEIIGRLPQEHDASVIPKESFIPTLTPLSDYTDILIEYCQDPAVKLQLAEDFKRYSLKYACETLELMDHNMDNIIKGVTQDNKTENKTILGSIVTKKVKTNMVFVKNCENRNWMKTNRPTMDHVTCDDVDTNNIESDHGYDSENTSKEKETDSVIDKSHTNLSTIDENNCIENRSNDDDKKNIIQEEDEDKNIFDDCFEDLDFKEECERNSVIDEHVDEEQYDNNQVHNEEEDEDFDRRSDAPDMPKFNPETFDREGTIKELVLVACRKYKIPIPAEYRTTEPRKRKERSNNETNTPAKRSRKNIAESKAKIQELLSNYYNCIQNDFITKVQAELSLVRNSDLNLNQNNHSATNIEFNVIERNASIESGLQSPIGLSERNSTIGPVDEQNMNLDLINKTGDIDEALENTLFEDDEMKLDDVVPKGDPKFDEQKYDISQLYIKLKREEEEEIFDVKDDPEIDKILQAKIEECKHSSKLKAGNKIEDCVKKKADSDSEDDLPLSVIKEEMIEIEEMFRAEEKYDRLINKVELPEIKYWVRHYDPLYMAKSKDLLTKFDEELKQNTPASFYFVIQECALILNCSTFYLYKNMQFLEDYLVSRCKKIQSEVRDTNNLLENAVESPE